MLNLKELRLLTKETGQEVADALGIERSLYVRYENGSRTPPLENLKLLSEHFHVTLGCIAGMEPIPEGYPDLTYFPVSHEQVVKDQQKAAEEGRIMNPEFQPAYTIGKEQPEPGKTAKKKPPFTREQEEYLEEMEDRIVSKMTAALREDTSLSSEEDAQ